MEFELKDLLQWGWGVFLGGFWFLWKETRSIRSTLNERADIVNHHDTRIAVLEATQKSTSDCLVKIEGHLRRIEDKLDAKADK